MMEKSIGDPTKADDGDAIFSNLTLLPKDLVESILGTYCDGYTLLQFWLAVTTCQRMGWWEDDQDVATQGSMWLQRIIDRRYEQLLTKVNHNAFLSPYCLSTAEIWSQAPDVRTTSRSSLAGYRTNAYSSRLSALDCCQQIPLNMIWCGKLQFKDPRIVRPFDRLSSFVEAEVKAMLVMCPGIMGSHDLRLWYKYATQKEESARMIQKSREEIPRVEVVLQNYHFLPRSPQGRLVGLTPADQTALQRISQLMQRDDLVGTLSTGYCTKTGPITHPFIIRVMSFSQGRGRIAQSPSMASRFEEYNADTFPLPPLGSLQHNASTSMGEMSTTDENSLLCCWESDDEDEARTTTNLRILQRYCWHYNTLSTTTNLT